MRLDIYDNKIYTLPLWEGDTVFHEPLIFLKPESGLACAKPFSEPEEIISVRSAALDTEYRQGEDYFLEGGVIYIPESSRIPVMDKNAVYCEKSSFPSRDKKHFYDYLAGKISLYQAAVTYRRKGGYGGFIPRYCPDLLPRVTNLIKSGKDIKITFVGDSITANGDTSGSAGVKPFMPKYPDMVTEGIMRTAGIKVDMKNYAVGGTLSYDFFRKDNVEQDAQASKPDLLVIAYGMNDGGGLGTKPETFAKNICDIADSVRNLKPECEVIAVSTVIPNTDACWSNGNPVFCYQDKYEQELLKCERVGFAVARITSIYSYVQQHKGFLSLTANGINHPNDFVVRLYAQTLLTMLGCNGNS